MNRWIWPLMLLCTLLALTGFAGFSEPGQVDSGYTEASSPLSDDAAAGEVPGTWSRVLHRSVSQDTEDAVTLALGNSFGGVLFNPTELVPTTVVPCDTTQFRSAYMRRTPAFADSCLDVASLTTSAVPSNPRFGLGTDHQHAALWWDLSAIPDDVTIVEAYLCLDMKLAGIPMDDTQGVYAVLDTLSSDTAWTVAAAGACTTRNPHQSNTGWDYMDRRTRVNWSPSLDSRSATYHWGIRSPLAHGVGGDASVLESGDDVMIDVKDALQYWVDFHEVRNLRQAGWWIGAVRPATGSSSFRVTCGSGAGDRDNSPTLIVRYLDQPFDGYRWNGFPFVFVFTTDDGHADNLAYREVFDARGLKFTLFAAGDRLDIAHYLTTAQLRTFFDDGYDIGNHGSVHVGTSTIPQSALGSLLARGWLAAKLGLVGADTMRIRAYAFAFGDTANQGGGASAAIPMLNAFGYGGARLAGNISTYSETPLLWDAPSPVFTVNKWNWNYLADNNDTHADSIGIKLRRVYGMSAYRGGVVGGEPIITLSHGTSTSGYVELNAEPLGLLLDVIAARGDTWITTFSEMMDYYRGRHASVGGLIWHLPAPGDTQPPAMPAGFTGHHVGDATYLSWLENTEPDFAEYRLYRGMSEDFAPDEPHLVARQRGREYVDVGAAVCRYKLCAVDEQGNVSEYAFLLPDYQTDAPASPTPRFALHPCAPNPFNPLTSICFDLPVDGPVILRVFDMKGALVATLQDGDMTGGGHRVVWDGRDASGCSAASGNYFARLEYRGGVETVRMSLVR